MENVVTHLSLVHLLFLGGKEPKNGWVITFFEFPAGTNRLKITGYFPPAFVVLKCKKNIFTA